MILTDEERAEFEKWCKEIGYTLKKNEDGDYHSEYGLELWTGWRARAARSVKE